MLTRRFVIMGLAAIGLLPLSRVAQAQAVRMMASSPTASAVLTGHSSEFFVRFDRPVDHVRSVFTITSDGKTVQTLHPRLNSEPDVLFARTVALAAGSYQLHWSVKSMDGEDITEGDIPFTIKS